MSNYIRPGNYVPIPSSDVFALPSIGGGVGARYGTMLWTGTVGTLFTLPAGAVDIDWMAIVSQTFNGGTASARIGVSGTNNLYASTIDIGTAALTRTGFIGSQMGVITGTLTVDTPILVTLNAPGTATQGTLAVVCNYMLR